MCNLNSQVSDVFLHHLCLSSGDFISPLPKKKKKIRTWIPCCWVFFSSGELISGWSTYCNIFPLGPRSRSRRSWLRAYWNRWGLSLNPWGNTVQVICWYFSPGASHSKAKRHWDSLANGMQRNASLRSRTVKNHLTLGFLPRILWNGGGLQLHLWSGDLELFAKYPPFSLQGGLGCYMVNWWGPIAHSQGIYLLEAIVLLELLSWGRIVSGLETEWDLRGQWQQVQPNGLV